MSTVNTPSGFCIEVEQREIDWDEEMEFYRDPDGGVLIDFHHRRLNYPSDILLKRGDCDGWDSWAKAVGRLGWDAFPVYAYDHGGIEFSLSPYSCPWDSGRIGSILVKRSIFPERGAKNKGRREGVAYGTVSHLNDLQNKDCYHIGIIDRHGEAVVQEVFFGSREDAEAEALLHFGSL